MKTHYWQEWPCCSGTYIQNMAEYHNMIYLRDGSGLYVNLYIPSEVTFLQDGQRVTLRQEGGYPEAEGSTMTLKLKKPTRFTIRFRVPGWSNRMDLSVNGSPLGVRAAQNGWASIDREWKSGDTVAIAIPMVLRTVPVDRQHPDRVAIMHGPVVLAQDEACCRRPFSIAPTTDLNTRLIREGEGLRFRMTNSVPERHTRYLQPLYSVPGFWPYWIYFDLAARSLY
jgi:DUF1680 family protein